MQHPLVSTHSQCHLCGFNWVTAVKIFSITIFTNEFSYFSHIFPSFGVSIPPKKRLCEKVNIIFIMYIDITV